MPIYKIALNDFLARHCRIHPFPASADEEEHYLMLTGESKAFMTESHMREILRAVHQTGGSPASLRRSEEPENTIAMEYQHAPDHGIKQIKIPLKLVESLTDRQAFLILRNLEGIQKDIDDGRIYKDRLESLFQDTADISISSSEEGERLFEITGKIAPQDRRRYMERYAEHVASRTLFDVAKALNSKLSHYVPEDQRGKFFVEGRDFSDKKVRYGEEVGTEVSLCDEGACVYTQLVTRNPHLRDGVAKVLQQAMLDPFGLSMAHYMGKHNVLKIGKRPLVKVPALSSFFGWVKGLFVQKEE